jgi:hypothetical protein
MVLALTTGEWITVSLASLAFAALLVSASQLRLGIVALRRGWQPVIVVHEVSSDIAPRGDGMEFRVYLENHGLGAAFNVRFGIELAGVRYPYTFGESTRGARQLVPTGSRVPKEGELRLVASWAPYAVGEGQAGARRAFWARFENAFGETWQTSNPVDPAADFEHPKRVRRRALRRLEEEELRHRVDVEAQAGGQLVAELDEVWRRGQRQ